MSNEPIQTRGPPIRALTQELVGADDPQIMRIVALVDAMMLRGSADQLIEPLRQRLALDRRRRRDLSTGAVAVARRGPHPGRYGNPGHVGCDRNG
jgi:hypothetical protein